MHFEKTIYLDRFMAKNRLQANTGDYEIYKQNISKLRDGLQYYTSFGKEKSDLCKALRTTIDFYKTHAEDELTLVDIYDNKNIVYDPKGIEINGNAENIIKALEDTLNKILQQIDITKKAINDYENKLKKCESMHKYPYDLHSIIMHSGTPDFGHYYAYIWDKEKSVWRKYNDENVTEVDEKEVFQEAIGDDKSSTSAYYLLYVARREVEGDSERSYFASSASKLLETKPREMMKYYSSLLPFNIKKEVEEDNLKLNMEVIKTNSQWICNEALEMYKNRHNKLMQSKKVEGYNDWNFISNLKSRNSSYYRYILLDSIIKEITGLSLEKVSKILHEELNVVFKKYSYAPTSINLSSEQILQLEVEEKVFRDSVLNKRLQGRILDMVSKNQWEELLNAVEIYLSNEEECEDKKIVLDLLRILVLRFMSLINAYFMQKDSVGALSALKLISDITSFYISSDDPHMKHFKRYIEYTFGECKHIFEAKEKKEFAEELKLLSSEKTNKHRPLKLDRVLYLRT